MGTCRRCQVPLSQIPWNSGRDMLLCENVSCPLFRQPQGSVGLAVASERVFEERLAKLINSEDQPGVSVDLEGDGDG